MKIEFKAPNYYVPEDGEVIRLDIDVQDKKDIGGDTQYFVKFSWTSRDDGTPNVYHSTLAHWRKAASLDELVDDIKKFCVSYKRQPE